MSALIKPLQPREVLHVQGREPCTEHDGDGTDRDVEILDD